MDGNAGLGAVVGQFSMELAIEKVWTTYYVLNVTEMTDISVLNKLSSSKMRS